MLDQSVKAYQEEIAKNKRLRTSNAELGAQLTAMEALEACIEELKREKQYLFNRVTQLESGERDKAKQGFAEAISNQPVSQMYRTH